LEAIETRESIEWSMQRSIDSLWIVDFVGLRDISTVVIPRLDRGIQSPALMAGSNLIPLIPLFLLLPLILPLPNS
jgi:hypothetical protein